mmetsp:Transcript_17039/g.26592  ORF Transcript_17039/g.26592 Transcript_17039/m.26592 type:complete len:198 (-) Transcript_17039:206-799(-)
MFESAQNSKMLSPRAPPTSPASTAFPKKNGEKGIAHIDHDNSVRESEIANLRAQNLLLRGAVAALKQDASDMVKVNFERVWFANNRICYPASEHSRRLEVDPQHRDAILCLRGGDSDYHHGFNSGLLAAGRLFRDNINVIQDDASIVCSDTLTEVATMLEQKLQENRGNFPNSVVDPHGGWSEVIPGYKTVEKPRMH